MRSKQSLPTSRDVISVSSSSPSPLVAFHSARSTSSTTSISWSASGTMLLRKSCCFRIIPGACSAIVTSISTARNLVSSSSCAAVTIWIDICTRGSMCLRKNLGASSAIPINSSRAVRDISSSFSLSAAVSTWTMWGMRSLRAEMWFSMLLSACTRHAAALSAARRTSLLSGSARVARSISLMGLREPRSLSPTTKVRREKMSMADSRRVLVGLLAELRRKGSISGHSRSSMTMAAISPVVSAILWRTDASGSLVTAVMRVCLTPSWVVGESLSKSALVMRLRTMTADMERTDTS
mmetsp:Transcript_39781/g.99568  ORF Transcript_39781/g.99568 Transcript_39781/m.99568 type:complete len:295 (-) Transcript_39781:311-1195(-)